MSGIIILSFGTVVLFVLLVISVIINFLLWKRSNKLAEREERKTAEIISFVELVSDDKKLQAMMDGLQHPVVEIIKNTLKTLHRRLIQIEEDVEEEYKKKE
jgi:biopolymer transport protein ExbB/TolQ